MLTRFLGRIALAAALALPVPALAVECNYCTGKSPDRLIRDSVYLGSPALRAQIRGWLAENHPDTGAGLTARAWVAASNNAPAEEVAGLYRAAVEADPGVGLAWTNMGFRLSTIDRNEEAVDAFVAGAKVWRDAPFFLEYASNILAGPLNDPQRAEAMLQQAARENWVEGWIPDYVRGVRARRSGDRRAADRLFEQAIAQGGSYHELITAWLDNRLALLRGQRASRSEIMQAIDRAADLGRRVRSDAVLRHAGKILWDDYNNHGAAYRLFVEAYEMRPTPEAAAHAFGVAANDEFDLAWRSLDRGLRDFPHNYLLLETAAWAWTNFRLEPARAEDFARRAVAAAPTQAQLESTVRQFADFARDSARHDLAVPVLEAALRETTGQSYINVLGAYIDNRIYARDFGQAARLLDQARERNFSDHWIAVRDNRISTALRLETARDRFFAENPFLRDWEQRFGESLRVTVEFATGKADLRDSAFSVLDQAAQALRAPGAENYVFLVEGHTDSTGTDAVNLPLSQARAGAVAEYFVTNAGIAPERVQTVGYGPRIPLATNATDAGKQTNRRVEIRPYGNVSAPRISAQGWLNGHSLALSPDGRFAVTGHTPAQVWDLERMTRVHQLPIGGANRKISPNGRYIAFTSSYRNVNGATDNAVYIYDMRTGLLHTQIPNNDTVSELSWSPFSDALAFTDRNGFLRVFDLAERSMRVTKMDDIRGTEDMTWVNTGRHIVTKAPRTPDVRVYDATTLQRVRSLDNVGWVHGMTSTHDGAHLVMVTNDRLLIVFETGTWREVRRQQIPAAANGRLVPHPNRQQVMIVDVFGNQTALALVDVERGTLVSSLRSPGDNVELDGGFTPDGAYWITAFDGAIRAYDTATLSPARTREGAGMEGRGITIVDRLNLAVAADEDGTSVYSLETGRQVHRLPGKVTFRWRELSDDGTVLYTFNDDGALLRFDLSTFRVETVRSLPGKPHSLSDRDGRFAVGIVPQGEGPFQDPLATVMVFDKATLDPLAEQRVQIVSEPVRYPDIYNPQVIVRLSEDGHVAVTSSWVSGFEMERT